MDVNVDFEESESCAGECVCVCVSWFVSVEFCGYVFVGQSLCVSVCSSADSRNFVYVTPAVFFFPPGRGMFVCVLLVCLPLWI